MEAKIFGTRSQPSIRAFFQPRQLFNHKSPETSEILPSSSTPSSTPITSRLPKNASISKITESHIRQLRQVNALLLPVAYPNAFYDQILSPDPPISFSRVILWSDPEPKVIGGIVCRIEQVPEAFQGSDGSHNLYVQSLALLSPFRGKGLAAEALRSVIETVTTQQQWKVESVYAHVWTENTEVLRWYAAQGFKREETMLEGYYRKLKPDTAWVLRRKLMPSDFLSSFPAKSQPPRSIAAQCSPQPPSARSFQDQGPEQEWNDLPQDLLNVSQPHDSKAFSRSKSQNKAEAGEKARKKRVYPAAAFGK
ncbi:hypothetical protein K3495_g6354 [Podosphaera aphanis]|nr:hypothetical protein K3495_g6354 [Podosphaera aphanis]